MTHLLDPSPLPLFCLLKKKKKNSKADSREGERVFWERVKWQRHFSIYWQWGLRSSLWAETTPLMPKNSATPSPRSPLFLSLSHLILCLVPEKPQGKKNKNRKSVGDFGCFVLIWIGLHVVVNRSRCCFWNRRHLTWKMEAQSEFHTRGSLWIMRWSSRWWSERKLARFLRPLPWTMLPVHFKILTFLHASWYNNHIFIDLCLISLYKSLLMNGSTLWSIYYDVLDENPIA